MIIKDKDIELKYNLRGMLLYEAITNKPFEIKTMTDEYIYMYAVVLANNEIDLEFDEFITIMDEHPEYHTEFLAFLEAQRKKNELFDVETTAKKKG